MLFPIGDPVDTVFCDHFVWRDLIFSFDLDFYIIWDYTKNFDYKNYYDQDKESYVIRSLNEIKTIKPSHKTIYVKQGGQDLKTFTHPKSEVIYIIGKDIGRDIAKDDTPRQEIKADIEIGIYYPNQSREVWAICAASIILYDRLIKLK